MKLQPLLSEYLYTNGNLTLEEAGQLKIQQACPQLDMEGRNLMAPVSTIVFQQDKNEKPDDKLADFIGQRLQISELQAQELLKQNKLTAAMEAAGGNLTWPLIGLFSMTTNGNISFQPENFGQQYLSDITLLPVQKTIAVETEISVEETVIEIAEPVETKTGLEEPQIETVPKKCWWVGALIIFVLSLILIAYRYL